MGFGPSASRKGPSEISWTRQVRLKLEIDLMMNGFLKLV